MIRTDRLALTTEDFAAERKSILEHSDDRLRDSVRSALIRLGLPGWENALVNAALDVFDETAASESDSWTQVHDDLRDEFQRQLSASLKKTKLSSNRNAQIETLTRWLSTAAVNGGTEAAAVADTTDGVGLEWVTMGDKDVREIHRDVAGQTVPTGHAFDVAGQKLYYPGQPVGEPEVWINCRCVVRPTMLTEAASKTITAAAPGLHKDGTPPKCHYCKAKAKHYVKHSEGMAYIPACLAHLDDAKEDAAESAAGAPDTDNINEVGTYALGDAPGGDDADDTDDDEITTAVIVALPADSDPVNGVASEQAHVTLLFLGESSQFDPQAISVEVWDVADTVTEPFTENVSGTGTLGDGGAEVLLLDAKALVGVRDALLAKDATLARYNEVDQFPTWIPHLTLGYPDTPPLSDAIPKDITFDRLAIWHGGEQVEFPFGGAMVAAGAPENTDDEPQAIPEEGAYPEVPWHGVLAPEGAPSGDGRQFAPGSLRNRTLPLPLKWMPADSDGHDGSVVVGRIDRIFRDGGLIKAEGVFDQSDFGYEALRQIANEMLRGVSVDIDDATAALDENDEDLIVFSDGRIASATLCAIPAFAEAYIALGPWSDVPDAAASNDPAAPEDAKTAEAASGTDTFDTPPPQTMDGPGWITEPNPTHRITAYWVDGKGAAKIGWGVPGDFNRCRIELAKYVQRPEWLAGLCANLHYRALSVWPGRELGGEKHVESAHSLAAAGNRPVLSADLFRDPELDGPTPFTVTDDGHVFGHIATWGVCHIGIGNSCVTAPHSNTGYSYFLTGEVATDAGRVPVGQITMGGGHASLKAGLRAASRHYDSTSAAVADVTVGEDEHGIWVSGVLRPGVSDEDRHSLMAAALSGDWREVRSGRSSNLEMVAALAVNVPGFPIPRPSLAASGENQLSLVAASILAPRGAVVGDDSHTIEDQKFARADAARAAVRSLRAAKAKTLLSVGGR